MTEVFLRYFANRSALKIMAALHAEGGALPFGVLAGRADISPPTLSKQGYALIEYGALEKKPGGYKLTDRGRKIAETLIPALEAVSDV